jgi:hypothetical protein
MIGLGGLPMREVVLYTRLSTDRQTTENQERELRAIAARAGWNVIKVYRDEGISGAKGRDERPAFDALCKDAARRQFDMVIAWSVDRLGRSLQDLIGFLSELHVQDVPQEVLPLFSPASSLLWRGPTSRVRSSSAWPLTFPMRAGNGCAAPVRPETSQVPMRSLCA